MNNTQELPYNFKSIKKAIRTGAPFRWIKEHLKSAYQTDQDLLQFIGKAKEEIFEEDVVHKTSLGLLLYK